MRSSNKTLMQVMTGFMLTVAALAALASMARANDGAHLALKARAARLFQYDERFQGGLPAAKLRALSVAISFHDDSGSAAILTELERQLPLR